ncbi:hypothetical protein BJ166DRAFT_495336 [Pestalotiopsis sp. NC0098]|nr:hypothetical protein BJ166DRAFT_495336 [Pestalotiopsis sp. NC0098]
MPKRSGGIADTIVFITGADRGIGYEVARNLSSPSQHDGYHVIIGSLSDEDGADAVARLLEEDPARSVTLQTIDVTSDELWTFGRAGEQRRRSSRRLGYDRNPEASAGEDVFGQRLRGGGRDRGGDTTAREFDIAEPEDRLHELEDGVARMVGQRLRSRPDSHGPRRQSEEPGIGRRRRKELHQTRDAGQSRRDWDIYE